MIANRYRLEDEIGKGGMGTVYKGFDTQTGQTVAIKYLKTELTSPELIERFQREGEALRELNHPNIVKMLDAVEENGDYYLIIEYLAGGDLSGLLKQGQLPLEKVLQIAIDICDALTRAHRLNIIHRDLKPANILLAEDGTPRLTDFGIAHFAAKTNITEADIIVGTADYLAPEIIKGEQANALTDIWAFGVMLFEMLIGQRPFAGETRIHIFYAIATQPVPDLEQLRPDIPVALMDLIYRMLEKEKLARIASIRQVGLEAENILIGRSTDSNLLKHSTRFATQSADSKEHPKHNLPSQPMPFIGREAEIAHLKRLVTTTETRFVTIIASGGMGKSWIAVEVGRQVLDDFADGVFWIDLTPLQDVSAIVLAMGKATHYLFQHDKRSYQQQIIDFLASKHILLIFDNFEHLLDGADIVQAIILATASVHVLVTSREKLHQSNETLYTIGGMNYPDWYYDAQTEYDALNLFVQTAGHIQPEFDTKTVDMPSIIRICQLVQGLPLGIVLAASWVSMLSPQEIADEIAQGLDILETDATDIQTRHRSIRAVFDYSWNAMSEIYQQIFMKITIFKGGFTREAAEAITGATLRSLMNLINKSLIRRDLNTGRFYIHELLRQYGFELLQKSGSLTTICQLYSTYYLKLIGIQRTDFKQNRQLEVLRLMDSDGENIRQAWSWAIECGHLDNVANAFENLCQFYDIRQLPKEKYRLLDLALQHIQVTDDIDLYLRLLSSAWLTPKEGRSRLRTVLALATQHKLNSAIANCLYERGMVAFQANHYAVAATFFERAVCCYRELRDDNALQVIPFWISVLIYSGCFPEAEKLATDILPALRHNNNIFALARTLANYGSLLTMRGAVVEALNYQREAYELFTKLGNRLLAAHIGVWGMSFAALRVGDFEQVRLYAEELLALATEYNQNFGIARAYSMLSNVELVEGHAQKSYDLASEAMRLFDGHINIIEPEIFRALAALTLRDYATAQIALEKWLAVTSHNLALLNVELTVAAVLLAYRGKNEQARTVLECAVRHPASGGKWLEKVIQGFEFADDLRPRPSYHAAPDLETVVRELLAEFGENQA
jgi:serine/threonine protein kinase/tetratricopeptide (TPR) repeat protein